MNVDGQMEPGNEGDMDLVSTTRLTPLAVEDSEAMSSTQAKHAHQLLYTSHFFSTWNSRLFEFGAFLFLASLYPSTLLPASVYALARAAAGALFSPWIGSYIDANNRLELVRISITGQRLPVILSCAIFSVLDSAPETATAQLTSGIALTGLSILACLEKLASIANTIAVERDWVVVIAGTDESSLSDLNSKMRRIDLFCKIMAPLAVSLVAAYSTKIAVISTGLLSAISWAIEYFAIARVYHAVAQLQAEKVNPSATTARGLRACSYSLTSNIDTYCSSPAILPSLSLSLLYLTALSFNGQLITYLLAPPQSLSVIGLGVLRGLAACAELSATWSAPAVIKLIGPLRAGSWFLNAQLIFIGIAASLLWMPALASWWIGQAIFTNCVILSRVGLWGFDLAAQQQIQDAVPEHSRGAFSSIEAALQNTLEMVSFATTIIWSAPEEFKVPALISAVAVFAAAILYATFVRQNRGHLLHFEKGLCGSGYWRSHFGKSQTWTRLPEDDAEDQ